MTNLASQLLELTYIVIGCQFLHTAYCSYKDKTNPVRFGTAGFWALLGISFMGGSYLPSICIGVIVVLLALLTLFKRFVSEPYSLWMKSRQTLKLND